MIILATIAIVALVGGGTSLAAQAALPGDVLYPIKINVNEKVGAFFNFSTEARARYEAQLAEARLQEAAELAAEGRLEPEANSELEANFELHFRKAKENIQSIENEGRVKAAADVSSDFEASLKANEQILAKLEAKDKEAASIKAKIEAALDDILDVGVGLESKIASSTTEGNQSAEAKAEVKAAAEGKLKAAENFIASTRAFIELKRKQLGAEATANTEARLNTAVNLLTKAKAEIEAEAFGEAFNTGNEAMRTAQEARALVEAKVNLNVDVNAVGDSGTTSSEAKGGGGIKLRFNY